MSASALGHEALALIGRVLAEKPEKNGHALSEATVHLAGFRDGLIADWRANGITPAQRKRLGHVNATLSVVLAIHFPLGAIRWDELEKARSWLVEAVDADGILA